VNKQKFVDLLRQPSSISDSNLIELEELVDESPYFHSAHTMIARASKLLKSSQANKKVNTAAIYATSRKALKKYIQGATEFKDANISVVELPRHIATPDAREIPKEVIVENVKIEEVKVDLSNKDEPRSPLSVSDHDSLIDEVYDNIEEWRKSRNHFLEYELSIEEAALKKNVKQSSDVDKIKSKIAEEIIAEEEEVAQAMKGIKKPVPKTKKKAVPTRVYNSKTTPAKKTPIIKASSKTSKAKATTTKKAPVKKAIKPKSSIKSTQDSDSSDGEKKKPKESTSSKLASKKHQNVIIEKFITTRPSIQTGKLKDFGEANVDLSEKSNMFPGDVITENLANIFESQGKADKAISIYEKLILKSPEKKSYFASRIENIKNK
jgi:tetratricopeptide (TPR) repeat protein